MLNGGESGGSSENTYRQALHMNHHEGATTSSLPRSAEVSGAFRGFSSVESFEIASAEEDEGSTLARNGTSMEEVDGSALPRNGTSMEPPNFGYYQLLIGSLMLTTLLAVAAGYDAKSECIHEEMYWLNDFLDDDENNAINEAVDDVQEGRAECLEMFQSVLLPVGASTVFLGAIALFSLRRHVRSLEAAAEGHNPSHIPVLLKLFLALFMILAVWTYAIFTIMLTPKVNPSLYNENPYKSLAAVDQMGHIGDNANLYYLSWICQAQIMSLVYHVMVEFIRRFGRSDEMRPQIEQVRSFSEQITMHEQIQTMLSYTSARRIAALYKMKRQKWYQFMYHLRERSGIWVAAFFSSVMLVASSAYVFVQVLVTLASSIHGDDDFRLRDVCTIVRGSEQIPQEFCIRSSFAVIAGTVASGLCFVALIMHLLVRRRSAADEDRDNSCTVMATQVFPGAMDPETYRLQLAAEFLLSFCASALLGINAVFATGVQGPASTVGNLYYASWLSFLLCLRICLGCLEELYHVRTTSADSEMATEEPAKYMRTETSQISVSGSERSFDMTNYKRMAKKERQSRLRKYFFLAIFSAICYAAAWDAAYNQGVAYSRDQRYLIFAPAFVSVISVMTFLLCLKPKLYAIVSHIWFGGLLSIVCFVVWLVDIIILMHSDDSWAVNSIGEMKLANLYYFSCELVPKMLVSVLHGEHGLTLFVLRGCHFIGCHADDFLYQTAVWKRVKRRNISSLGRHGESVYGDSWSIFAYLAQYQCYLQFERFRSWRAFVLHTDAWDDDPCGLQLGSWLDGNALSHNRLFCPPEDENACGSKFIDHLAGLVWRSSGADYQHWWSRPTSR
jgi:hypothetical protein